MWPDALDQLVRRARIRLRLGKLAVGVGIGTVAAIAVLAGIWFGRVSPRAGIASSVAIMLVALGFAWWRARSSRAGVVAIIERRAPAFRNLLVTSAELAEHSDRAQPAIRSLVWADAAAVAAHTDARAVVPLRRAGIISAVSGLAWLAAAIVLPRMWASSPAIALASGQGDAAVVDLSVRVEPPAYTGSAASSLRNPDRLDVLSGTRLTFEIEGRAASMKIVQSAGDAQALASVSAGRFTGSLVATSDGYVAVEPMSAAGIAGPRRLVPLTVEPDRPPSVRVTAPAKDLYVGDTSKTIDVSVAADDDLAVRSLKLVYTKVSGSGENFTFTDGEAPLRLTKTSDRSWTGQGTLTLPGLSLVPGDTLVYRAVALDSLPSRAPVESDSFLVQVLSPSDVATEGFATGDDREKYALSEQMIVVKTEQLHAKRSTLAADALNDEAMGLSAMQRSVRAEFVFMLGGELEDIEAEAAATSATELHEENEAAGEQDLLAGRMQNQGRQDVLVAIRRMSDAATSLAVADTTAALVAERAAVVALQRAFSKSRLILRTLSVRERIDPTRRLSGDAKGEADWRRPLADSTIDSRVATLRRAVDDLTAFAGRTSFTAGDRARLIATAESILQVDPSASANRDAATRVIAAADAVAAGRDADRIAALVSEAAVDLAKLLRGSARPATDPSRDPVTATLDGALADRLRRSGGGR